MSNTADQESFEKLRQYVDGLEWTKAQKSEFLMKEWERICKVKQAERDAAEREREARLRAEADERERDRLLEEK